MERTRETLIERERERRMPLVRVNVVLAKLLLLLLTTGRAPTARDDHLHGSQSACTAAAAAADHDANKRIREQVCE